MTSAYLHLLEQIASGIVIFEPLYRRGRELLEFQATVERLLEMHQLGLVHQVWTQKREIAGTEYYDMAVVRGGLTTGGEQLLEEQRGAGQDSARQPG